MTQTSTKAPPVASRGTQRIQGPYFTRTSRRIRRSWSKPVLTVRACESQSALIWNHYALEVPKQNPRGPRACHTLECAEAPGTGSQSFTAYKSSGTPPPNSTRPGWPTWPPTSPLRGGTPRGGEAGFPPHPPGRRRGAGTGGSPAAPPPPPGAVIPRDPPPPWGEPLRERARKAARPRPALPGTPAAAAALTCQSPAAAIASVPLPPLEDEVGVGPLRHPQGVRQQHLLGVHPHAPSPDKGRPGRPAACGARWLTHAPSAADGAATMPGRRGGRRSPAGTGGRREGGAAAACPRGSRRLPAHRRTRRGGRSDQERRRPRQRPPQRRGQQWHQRPMPPARPPSPPRTKPAAAAGHPRRRSRWLGRGGAGALRAARTCARGGAGPPRGPGRGGGAAARAPRRPSPQRGAVASGRSRLLRGGRRLRAAVRTAGPTCGWRGHGGPLSPSLGVERKRGLWPGLRRKPSTRRRPGGGGSVTPSPPCPTPLLRFTSAAEGRVAPAAWGWGGISEGLKSCKINRYIWQVCQACSEGIVVCVGKVVCTLTALNTVLVSKFVWLASLQSEKWSDSYLWFIKDVEESKLNPK